MAIYSAERPGVYTSYAVSGVVGAARGGGCVGLCAAASKMGVDSVQTILRESDAMALYGEDTAGCRMMGMVRALLAGGAGKICAVSVPAGTDAAGYGGAFALLENADGIAVMTCDSEDAGVHALLLQSVTRASARGRERVMAAGAAVPPVEAISRAAGLNHERCVFVCQPAQAGNDAAACYLAAGVAAAVAGMSDVSAPLSGGALPGITSLGGALGDDVTDELLCAGVTVAQMSGGQAAMVRAVTTRTTRDGASDRLFHDISVILIIDNVLGSVRDALRLRLSGAKNNAQTRDSIATQTQLELSLKRQQGMIDRYDPPVVTQDEADPSVCNVALDFTVTRGINQIHISAQIQV